LIVEDLEVVAVAAAFVDSCPFEVAAGPEAGMADFFLTLSMVNGYCLLLSGNMYHMRFLKISFLMRVAVPL
jgi:hypothetical protein